MTDSSDKWGGQRATKARTFVLRRDNGICWICGHPGANCLDHVKPRATHPELKWKPSNWKAAHQDRVGTERGCTWPGCECIGNRLRGGGDPPARGGDPEPSREW